MSSSVTAAETAKSTIGLQGTVIAPMTADTSEGTTYGTLQAVEGAIEAVFTPGNTDPDVQHADDVEWDVLYPDPEHTFRLTLADLPLNIQKMIMNEHVDASGAIWSNADDVPPYFAIGFKSEKSDHNYRYVWLLKCRAKLREENYGTKEGATINRQTAQVEFTAIKRTSDGYWRVKADEGVNGFTATTGATFLQSVPGTFTAPT